MFPNLPVEPSRSEQHAARVCIATYEILGPSRNGGVGTAYYSLATTLAAARHEVTILYLWAGRSAQSDLRHWESHFRSLGIAFVPLPNSPNRAAVPTCMLTAGDALAWLRRKQFDVIHFPELHGHGYYCVLAKHQGLAFGETTLCIGTHSPMAWIREKNKEAPYSPEELEMDLMERQSVALADVVVSPSQYMLRWMQSRGWSLPATCYVQQNIVSAESAIDLVRPRGGDRVVDFVFFGRLEARKGISLFCDALDLVKAADVPAFTVSFLGKNGQVDGRDGVRYIRARAARWQFRHRIMTEYGREAALRFLSEDGRVAIIPSFEDNLPYTVLECLAAKIPFLAGAGGGIPELIAAPDLERVTFPPDAAALGERLVHALRAGVRAARPALDADENRRRWSNWHATLASQHEHRRRTAEQIYLKPAQRLVTVHLNYRGEGELLRQSLQSLRRQSYRRLEVLVWDDSPAGTDTELQRVMQDFPLEGWRSVSSVKAETGAASGAGAQTRGEYVLFMAAADYLDPEALAVFVKVANSTGAEVLTCFAALFSGVQEPAADSCLGHVPFLGEAVVPGVFRNHFGSGAIFVQSDTLLRLGGYPGSAARDCADWEFLARAALMQCRLEVIPIPLLWRRVGDKSDQRVSPTDYQARVQALTPYAQAMPAMLRELPKAAFTMGLHYQRMSERIGNSPMQTTLRRLGWKRKGSSLELADEGALLQTLNQMPAHARDKIALVVDGWLEFSAARSRLPPPGFQRLSHVARQLVRGHYHRYGHGLGSALRDLRKPVQSGTQKVDN